MSVYVYYNVDSYDESLWKGGVDLCGKTLKEACVSHLLSRGVSVVRLAKAEVCLFFDIQTYVHSK